MPQWYYGSAAGQSGPVEEHEIRALIAAGTIVPETLVCRDGMKDWSPMRAVPEFSGQPLAAYPAPYHAPFPGAAGYPVIPVIPNSGLAIASMVCGIVGICTCYFAIFLGIPAVICGHMALSQINNSQLPMGGRGMAIAGLVLGYLEILITVGFGIFLGIAIATGNP